MADTVVNNSISYKPTTWENEKTPLNAGNMNNIEVTLGEVVNRVNSFQNTVNEEFMATKNDLQVKIDSNGARIDTLEKKELKITTNMSLGRLTIEK